MATTRKATNVGLYAQREAMLFCKFERSERIDEDLPFCMRGAVLGKHATGLCFRAATFTYGERVVITTAGHVTLADPGVDQRLELSHKIVRLVAVRRAGVDKLCSRLMRFFSRP